MSDEESLPPGRVQFRVGLPEAYWRHMRDDTLARFVAIADLAERSTSVGFWRIWTIQPDLRADLAEQRVWSIQAGLYAEARKLADELWPIEKREENGS